MSNTPPDWLIEQLSRFGGRYHAIKSGNGGDGVKELLEAAQAIQARFEAAVGEPETEVHDGELGLSPEWQRCYARNLLRAEARRAWSGEGEQ